MALFGKKKGEAPQSPESTQTPSATPNLPSSTSEGAAAKNEDVFDFDAIARDLESQGGASPFDAILSAPATPGTFDDGSKSGAASGSAFDFPDTPSSGTASSGTSSAGTLDLDKAFGAAPSSGTSSVSGNDPLSNLDALFGSPAAPPPMPTAPSVGAAPIITPTPAAALPIDSPPTSDGPPKKSLPLLPILGALGVLAIAGGAGYLLTQGGEETEPTSIVANVQTNQDTPPDESGASTSELPSQRAQLPQETPAQSGVVVAPTSPSPTASVPRTSTQTTTTQTTTQDVPPELLVRLKNLWEQGKAAKARGDYQSARQFWTQALQLRPGHPGFQESINKLPATNKSSAAGSVTASGTR